MIKSKTIHDKITQQAKNRRELPQPGKEHLQKPTNNIILTDEKLFFPTNAGKKARMSHNTALLFIIIPKALANAIRKENITYINWEGRN